MKKIEQKIITWIRKKIKETGAKGAVIGLSGGIDSSVVGALLVKALGRKRVRGVIMPCESQIFDTVDGKKVAKKFGIKTVCIPLTNVYINFVERMALVMDTKQTGTSNLKARLRMCTLYYIANSLNYLVIGTGNKTELAIGYLTKYGDGGVDIEPIGDLYKKDVVKLAKHLGIPKEIINKPPSAGLWEGQTDEKEMGITYEKLDKILLDEEYLFYQSRTKDTVKVRKMIRNSEHKRKSPPICKL